MMRRIALLLLAVVMMAAVPLAAQEDQEGENLFAVTIPAYKIYPHAKGYVVSYWISFTKTAQIFLPYEWFHVSPAGNEEPPKGYLRVLGPGNLWPRISIFYRDGQFSYVKLYVRQEKAHESWGSSLSMSRFDTEFENANPPVLKFGTQAP
ncbi:MAG: hypothetical protein LBK61_08480 [Spirochaetaceae bacterium]|jgi:hypothetical protein|nr:hypothetical protein [Spirochaetaceae bacterium]